MNKNGNLANFYSGLLGIIIALVFLQQSTSIKTPEDSGFFDLTAAFLPRLFSVLIIIFGIYFAVTNIPTKKEFSKLGKGIKDIVKNINIRKILFALVVVIYIYSLPILGYIFATFLFLVISVIFYDFNITSKTRKEWATFAVYVVLFPLIIYYSFNNLMLIPLP